VNIPVAEIKGGSEVMMREVGDPRWGPTYVVPVVKQWPPTQIAVNVGGALIPTLLSIYFVVRHQIYSSAALGVAAVAAVVHLLAEPVPQMGISVPIFIPPIVSALVAVLLSREHAAPLAYVAGCMGTLVGADLLNLDELAHLGASIASIGGAGTFDGVFLTGILAAIPGAALRRLAAQKRRPPQRPSITTDGAGLRWSAARASGHLRCVFNVRHSRRGARGLRRRHHRDLRAAGPH
jgi:uncharacterized membrane protein